MRETRRFFRLVLRHWIVLTGGSLVALILLVWQIFTGKPVQWWAYAVIAVSTLFVSCFLAWKVEYVSRVKAEQQLAEEKAANQKQLTEERGHRLRVEQQLADEKAHKLTVDEIVLKEARVGFRNLIKGRDGTIAPRIILNDIWIGQTAERYGVTIREIEEAIDRLDGAGRFHWQG
jgi:predicted nucleic acid-binding protein